jgi:hypothetical protein
VKDLSKLRGITFDSQRLLDRKYSSSKNSKFDPKSDSMRLHILLPLATLFEGRKALPLEERSTLVISLALNSATSAVAALGSSIYSLNITNDPIGDKAVLSGISSRMEMQLELSKRIITNEPVLTPEEFAALGPARRDYTSTYQQAKQTLEDKVKDFFMHPVERESPGDAIVLLATLEVTVADAKKFESVLNQLEKSAHSEHNKQQTEPNVSDNTPPETMTNSTDNSQEEHTHASDRPSGNVNIVRTVEKRNFAVTFDAVISVGDAYLEKSEGLKHIKSLNVDRESINQYIQLEEILKRLCRMRQTIINDEPTMNHGESMAILYATFYLLDNLKKVSVAANKTELQPLIKQLNLDQDVKEQREKTDAAVERFWSALLSKMPFEPVTLKPTATEPHGDFNSRCGSQNQTLEGKPTLAVRDKMKVLAAAYEKIVEYFDSLPKDKVLSKEQQIKIIKFHANVENILKESALATGETQLD